MRRQRCRSWGTLLDAPDELERPPETEIEYVRYLQQKIADAQERHLLPLKEDVTDWLNATLGECSKRPRHGRIPAAEIELTRVDSP